MTEKRQENRYNDIGKVEIPEICALSGILDDISLSGCRVHFPCSVNVDMDMEYKVTFTPASSPDEEPLQLLCKPMWVTEKNDSTHIGFVNMYSPDEVRLQNYISFLEKLTQDSMPEII